VAKKKEDVRKKQQAKHERKTPRAVIKLGSQVAMGVSLQTKATFATIKTSTVELSVENVHNGDGRPAEWERTLPFRKGYNKVAPYELLVNVRAVLPNWDGKNWCALRHLLELGGVDYRQVREWSLWDVCMRLQLNPPYRQTCNMVELSDLAADRRKRMKNIEQQKRLSQKPDK
jgi:hypothetical protein